MRLVKHAGTYRGDIPIQPLPLAESLPLYRDHFPGPHLDLVLASMLAGNTAGELWIASEGDEPSLLLLWDRGNNNLYLSGAGARESSLASLATAITVSSSTIVNPLRFRFMSERRCRATRAFYHAPIPTSRN